MKQLQFIIAALLLNLAMGWSQTAATDAGTTFGGISVSPAGGAIYSIPIEVPPGIKDVAPNLSLTYSSQGGNGLAGWGWNISGLSSITRIPSTLYHDGVIDPVDFDLSDRYSLDGQRLLAKTGGYGKAGTEYASESHSNIRIFGYGTSGFGANYGPRYFVVVYPNGARAWYGQTGNSNGRMEWAINKWMDPQGNYVNYEYLQSNGILRISKISYGSRSGATSSRPLSVNFDYRTRGRQEAFYVGGVLFKRSLILSKITVKYDRTNIKEYVLGHKANSLGYQTIDYVQELDGAGRALEPINFKYGTTVDKVARILKSNISTYRSGYSFTAEDDKRAAGDFNGDGRMDVLTYDKTSRSSIDLIMDIQKGSNDMDVRNISTGKFDDILTGPILANNRLGQRTGIVTVSESYNGSGGHSSVSFKAHVVGSTGLDRVLSRTWSAPTYKSESSCADDYRYKTSKRYISGDFNGDGVIDVIALTYPYTERYCNPSNDCGGPQPIAASRAAGDCCKCTDYARSLSKTYFIDLNSTKTSNYANYSGQLQSSIKYNEPIYGVDFNGDGKTDLVHVQKGKISIYELSGSNALSHVTTLSDSDIELDKPILTGDFNGDGLYDLTIPLMPRDGSDQWKLFLSKGRSISVSTVNTGVNYYKNIVQGGTSVNIHYYTSQDLNSDGKTDILHHFIKVNGSATSGNGFQSVDLYANTSSGPTPTFTKKASISFTEHVRNNGLPIITEASTRNGTLEYAYLSGSQIQLYEFSRDNSWDTTLEQVTNRGRTTKISYDNLLAYPGPRSNGDVYDGDSSETYPYVNINLAPTFQVVERLEEKGTGITRYQDYRYSGAVAHAKGLGMLGFKRLHRSNWYGTNVTRLWNSSSHDPRKRGAVTKEWVSVTFGRNPVGQVSQTDFTYITKTLSSKVFVNVPEKVVTKDLLLGTTTTKSMTYDAYYSPLTVTTSNADGSKVETYTYSNNPSANNNYYHIGRLKTKKVSSTLDGDKFTSEEAYTYGNNLLKTFKKKGMGTDWITETYYYDGWGNITKKTLGAPGMSTRVETFGYDTYGRLLKWQKDTEGLTTGYTYHEVWGAVKTITDPFGRKTTSTYDSWNRIKTVTDYLGKVSRYSYTNLGNGSFQKKVDHDQGQDQI
ncbi:MAG: FG-GAP-like repeat-containing protein, partial [Flavobacteriaceae bacterium]